MRELYNQQVAKEEPSPKFQFFDPDGVRRCDRSRGTFAGGGGIPAQCAQSEGGSLLCTLACSPRPKMLQAASAWELTEQVISDGGKWIDSIVEKPSPCSRIFLEKESRLTAHKVEMNVVVCNADLTAGKQVLAASIITTGAAYRVGGFWRWSIIRDEIKTMREQYHQQGPLTASSCGQRGAAAKVPVRVCTLACSNRYAHVIRSRRALGRAVEGIGLMALTLACRILVKVAVLLDS
eukprot:s682_g23.t1